MKNKTLATDQINRTDFMTTQIIHTKHSYKRASQRGILNEWIETVINEGKVIYKQGLRFIFMTDKELRFHNPIMQQRLKNLMVIMPYNENVVVTCYKSKDAIGCIKRKSKRLSKN